MKPLPVCNDLYELMNKVHLVFYSVQTPEQRECALRYACLVLDATPRHTWKAMSDYIKAIWNEMDNRLASAVGGVWVTSAHGGLGCKLATGKP